jgi:hypothetical protein
MRGSPYTDIKRVRSRRSSPNARRLRGTMHSILLRNATRWHSQRPSTVSTKTCNGSSRREFSAGDAQIPAHPSLSTLPEKSAENRSMVELQDFPRLSAQAALGTCTRIFAGTFPNSRLGGVGDSIRDYQDRIDFLYFVIRRST